MATPPPLDSLSFLRAQSEVLATLQGLHQSLTSSSSFATSQALRSRLAAASQDAVSAAASAAELSAARAREELERDFVRPLALERDELRGRMEELEKRCEAERTAREEAERKFRKQIKDVELKKEQEIFLLKKQGYK